MVLPILFFAALGGSVWGIFASLWDVAEGNTNSPLSKLIETQLDSRSESTSEVEAEQPVEDVPGTEWRLRGVVYDLVSLKPISGCELTFTDSATRSREKCVTDSKGRYKITLAPLSGRGYQVTLVKSGYASNYLNPSTEDVAQMPAPSRVELSRDLAETTAEPAMLQPYDGKPFVTDFHLAPLY